MTYTTKLKVIHEDVEGIGEWLWPSHDKECWSIIKNDWNDHHSKKWFQYVHNFDVVLQAGGCCGLYPRLLANRFKWVYTFEPDPLSFHCMVNNCQNDHIIMLNAAVGNHNGLVGWSREHVNVGMNKIDNQAYPALPMIKIDDLNLRQLDLLALDLEGYEVEALKGASDTIHRLQPTLII